MKLVMWAIEMLKIYQTTLVLPIILQFIFFVKSNIIYVYIIMYTNIHVGVLSEKIVPLSLVLII